MKYERLFPTELTAEEVASGFILVETRLPVFDRETFGGHTSTVVAVRPLAPSFRLVKMLNTKLHHGDTGTGYQLQSFGRDVHPLNKYHGNPAWHPMWDGPSSTISLAMGRYDNQKPKEHWETATPPDEPQVPAN